MKNYIIAIAGALLLCTSCLSDDAYEELNKDPKNPTVVSADFLVNAATISLSDQMASTNVNDNIYRLISQYITPTTYTDEANYNLTERNIPQTQWSELYRDVLLDLEDAKSILINNESLDQASKNKRIAQIEILLVYTWQVLIDTFGDVPYTESLNRDIFLPSYEDDEAIYIDLTTRLSTSVTNLNNASGSLGSDLIYGGDASKWYMFGNSLLLRLAMRIADSNPTLSKSLAEEAFNNGVFSANEDGALINYFSTSPNTNPVWEDLVESNRADYVAANTLVDYMNTFNDPRRMSYFTDNIATGYVGGTYGQNSSYANFSHFGEAFLDPTLPGILMDYTEVRFLLAEAAQRGYAIQGTAQEHYDAAVTASIEYWGGSATDAATYLSQTTVAYNAVDWKTSIGTQLWIAMYNNPFQGWCTYRKFDAPVLNIAAVTELPVPKRYTYPVNEQNLNTTNYNSASDAIGGDKQQTPIFWDVN